jgi:hypothetical protein
LRLALLAAQIALTTLLLTGAGVLTRALGNRAQRVHHLLRGRMNEYGRGDRERHGTERQAEIPNPTVDTSGPFRAAMLSIPAQA